VRPRCTHARTRTRTRAESSARWLRRRASASERGCLDPIPISASRSSYRPAIAISSTDTHPLLNPVLPGETCGARVHTLAFSSADAPRSHCLRRSSGPIRRSLSDVQRGLDVVPSLDNAIANSTVKPASNDVGAFVLFQEESLLPTKWGFAKRERPGSGQPRFRTAAVIRDFTAAARQAGSETSYVRAGTNFLA